MPRKPRIEFEGAFYHVITRGNQRQTVFRDSDDYEKYLKILCTYKDRYRYHLYAYALMSNHVHLLIETTTVPLSKILQGINQSYTLHFNKKYGTIGHLFQGRYKAILCDKDVYLLALLKYIHNNAVRAEVTDTLDAYPWSSHYAYAGISNPSGLVDTDQVLRMFSESKGRARREYGLYVRSGNDLTKEEVYSTIDQRLQGDEQFIDDVQKKCKDYIIRERKERAHTLSALSKAVEQRYGVPLENLRSSVKGQEVMKARRVFALIAKEYRYQGKEIAEYLRKDPASVSGYLRGEDLRSEVQAVIAELDKEQ